MSEKHENRAETIERKMVIDLDRRRVTTLARLVGMLSIMAGDGPEIDGYDAAELHAEASMALGIEDEDDIDGMAAQIVEHGPDAHLLSDRWAPTVPSPPDAISLLEMLIAHEDEAKPNGIMDCVDNDGHPYQSAAMAGLITHARMLVAPYDHAAAIAKATHQ